MVLPYLTSMYTTPITSGGVHGENAKPPALILLASHPLSHPLYLTVLELLLHVPVHIRIASLSSCR